MGTRSHIIIRQGDRFARIYCHWDGYPSHHLPILTEAYGTQEKADRLAKLGDLSSLARKWTRAKGHSFAKPVDGHCVAYGRDRGDTGTEARLFSTLADALPTDEDWTEWVYLWDGSRWLHSEHDGVFEALTPSPDESDRCPLTADLFGA